MNSYGRRQTEPSREKDYDAVRLLLCALVVVVCVLDSCCAWVGIVPNFYVRKCWLAHHRLDDEWMRMVALSFVCCCA